MSAPDVAEADVEVMPTSYCYGCGCRSDACLRCGGCWALLQPASLRDVAWEVLTGEQSGLLERPAVVLREVARLADELAAMAETQQRARS